MMWRMALYPKPHSPEWFAALEAFNPVQAQKTRAVLELVGREDVCSVCGDEPANDYKLIGEEIPDDAVGSIRLCDDCKRIRSQQYGEQYAALDS